ncbi:hypothetical protein [uncultured Psychroserpens sp.]|uniref:hypothetical protein n=1 Tax=uncultured Psychroserpens sp. TaxID=255436 RepID=UPI0026052B77|nr:hypothetical protein [uncultured Psychroserpens sp.]
MSRKKQIVAMLLIVLGALVVFAIWYQYTFSMDQADAFQVNSKHYNQKLLIATQGSEFKDSVTKHVVEHFENDSIFINVVDVSALETIDSELYNAVLLVHTWENWKPPIEVKTFIEKNKSDIDNMVVITTSGEGTYKMDEIDAITGESKPENVSLMATKAINKLEILLKK